MEHLVHAVRQAVEQRNWYAALGLALTLPDICGLIEGKQRDSRKRYIRWCTEYLTPKYTHRIEPDREEHIFLSGKDCYALRCAVLHEGSDEIVTQAARDALESFRFVAPTRGFVIHNNQHDDQLQVQVDIFCLDICEGVERWFAESATDDGLTSRVGGLMKVHPIAPGFDL